VTFLHSKTLLFLLTEQRKTMVLTGGPRIKLANGILMPQVGLGTWQVPHNPMSIYTIYWLCIVKSGWSRSGSSNGDRRRLSANWHCWRLREWGRNRKSSERVLRQWKTETGGDFHHHKAMVHFAATWKRGTRPTQFAQKSAVGLCWPAVGAYARGI